MSVHSMSRRSLLKTSAAAASLAPVASPRAQATKVLKARSYFDAQILDPGDRLFGERRDRGRVAIDEALRCKEEGTARTILFNLCGHGHFDMQAYIDFQAGKLEDRPYDEAQLDAAFANLPRVAAE